MEEEWPNLQQYAWFTFVRDPVSKFESGVFELARRGAPCVLDAGANREGDELALNVLESCVLSKDRREEVDPHLRPSISYAADAPEKFNLQIASKRARSTVEQAFHADEMCLGYARRPQEKFRCVLDGC